MAITGHGKGDGSRCQSGWAVDKKGVDKERHRNAAKWFYFVQEKTNVSLNKIF
jgi:hypothetical protein